jgi:hypothetical protein
MDEPLPFRLRRDASSAVPTEYFHLPCARSVPGTCTGNWGTVVWGVWGACARACVYVCVCVCVWRVRHAPSGEEARAV